ncbi:MAG: efflux RND transporter periplasmic adaptor subunit [Gammaproteobacteria bacterium]|jgi:HlyD family secretion protein
MRFKYLLIPLLALAVVALVWYLRLPDPVGVAVAAVERGKVETTVANTRSGTVKACLRAKLSPGIGGQIAKLEVRRGDMVEKDDLLVELWNMDLQAQVQLARSELRASESRAQAACLQADNAAREAQRLKSIQSRGAASEEQVENAVTQAEALAADCKAAEATVEVAKSRIALAEAQLEKTRLRAPFDGVVGEIQGELNEYVTPSPPGIATIPVIDLIDNSCFYVTAPIDEVDVASVEIGDPARLTLDAYGDMKFSGKVRRVGAYVLDLEKQARTVDVEVEFDNPAALGCVLAGYSADVEIILAVNEETLRIPSEAVVEENHVYLLDTGAGSLVRTRFEPGMSNWDYTEVLSGLEEGDLVVTSVGKEGVEDGVPAVRETQE